MICNSWTTHRRSCSITLDEKKCQNMFGNWEMYDAQKIQHFRKITHFLLLLASLWHFKFNSFLFLIRYFLPVNVLSGCNYKYFISSLSGGRYFIIKIYMGGGWGIVTPHFYNFFCFCFQGQILIISNFSIKNTFYFLCYFQERTILNFLKNSSA